MAKKEKLIYCVPRPARLSRAIAAHVDRLGARRLSTADWAYFCDASGTWWRVTSSELLRGEPGTEQPVNWEPI